MRQLRPMNDEVVLKLHEDSARTKGGIIMPDSAKGETATLMGDVLACGPGALLKNGGRAPMESHIAETLLIPRNVGHEVELDGEKLWVIPESLILCKVENYIETVPKKLAADGSPVRPRPEVVSEDEWALIQERRGAVMDDKTPSK